MSKRLLTSIGACAHSGCEDLLGEFWRVVILIDNINDKLHGLCCLYPPTQCLGPQLEQTAQSFVLESLDVKNRTG